MDVEFEVGAVAAELPDVAFVGDDFDDDVLLLAPDDVLFEGAEADDDEFVLFVWA